jgi:diaminohydroxyphosphoribosylaminopyrimidine deaminase / 5-amino-6-(5-phosphoribosylamino)uracil reductase
MSLADTLPRAEHDEVWGDAVVAIRSGLRRAPPRWESIFGPLRAGVVDELMVVGQIGQSLDGRAATSTGHSHYINGCEGLDHLHRLRALADAVVIGIGTALADDPQLTVRRVAGPHPVRVVIDPGGRLPATARLLRQDGVRRLVITADTAGVPLPDGIERIVLPTRQGHFEPSDILASLAERGLRRILIEGGPATVARFLEARCLDRLHVVVAPIILGGGRSSLDLAPITRCDQALRPVTRTHVLCSDAAAAGGLGANGHDANGLDANRHGADAPGSEVLFDCDLSRQRNPIGLAKKST